MTVWNGRPEHELRKELVEAGALLRRGGLISAGEGNISVRLDARRLLVTPAGTDKGELETRDLVVTDLEGTRLVGARRPSSELGLHLEVYRLRPEVTAVVHAHPPTATGFAVAGRSLEQPLLAESVLFLGPVPLADYATTGTPEMGAAVRELVPGRFALLLPNHGAVAWGCGLKEAVSRMETLEQFAKVALTAELLGGAKALPADEVERLKARAHLYRSC